MNEQTAILLVLVGSLVTGAAWDLVRALRVRRLRGIRILTCPETGCPTAVRINVPRALVTSLVEGEPEIHLSACSRWVTRGSCDQPCAPAAQHTESAVAAVAERGFVGRRCASCGRTITSVRSLHHRPALLMADGTTVAWADVPGERLPEMMRTLAVVCWNCHMAESFRRTFPDLPIDRGSAVEGGDPPAI